MHELSNHVVLVYQPHQNIRQHQICSQYTNQLFKYAEKIYWLPTYLTREDPNLPTLSPEDLASHITDRDKIVVSGLDEELWANVQKERSEGKLILFMGAGTIDNWLRTKITADK